MRNAILIAFFCRYRVDEVMPSILNGTILNEVYDRKTGALISESGLTLCAGSLVLGS